MRVLIAGAGPGGLALAQRLGRAGVTATVLERDAAVDARAQGYRLTVNADGGGALRECLPPELFALFRATSGRPDGGRVVMYGSDFAERSVRTAAPAHPYTSVDRLTLRRVLLTGLRPRFGAAVTGFARTDRGVRARLADGTEVAGDLLVAADGAGSALRRALLPGAALTDLGVRCVWGRTDLAAVPEIADEPAWSNRVSAFTGPGGRTLVAGAWRPATAPEAAAAAVPGACLPPVAPYVMWALMVPGAEPLPGDLHAYVRAAVAGWDGRLRTLVARGGGCFTVPIRVALPVPPWRPGRVTLLGDAIHAMTPAGGTGANTALRDAALLGGLLDDAVRGGGGVVGAVAAYEERMRAYGFAAVARSRAYGADRGGPRAAEPEEARP
ncbi:MAG TPA: NAD(P)/FAD-dependent oxidoreductase [Streptosporangiaceae bacterium]|jgi:2-polyprenyl-6-methoxyphenol hydroxylase-like FAD-dependent oxidoreductase